MVLRSFLFPIGNFLGISTDCKGISEGSGRTKPEGQFPLLGLSKENIFKNTDSAASLGESFDIIIRHYFGPHYMKVQFFFYYGKIKKDLQKGLGFYCFLGKFLFGCLGCSRMMEI
jgi:hypothetical protein